MLMTAASDNEIGEFILEARTAKGMTKAALARELGISGSAISQWESGETKPTMVNLVRLGMVLEVPGDHPMILRALDQLSLENGFAPRSIRIDNVSSTGAKQSIKIVSPADTDPGVYVQPRDLADSVKTLSKLPHHGARISAPLARDVIVYGIAVAGDDADFSFNGQEINRVNRPPALADAPGIFALYVSNDSMYPAWRENAVAFIDRNRKPSIGDDVVIELYPEVEGEAGKAYFKRLVKRTQTKYIVEQFNPPKNIEIPIAHIKGVYRVVPWEEALGI